MTHDHIFVYGTLLTSAEHDMGRRLRNGASLVGRGSIQARLYIIDDPDMPGQNRYPGALPSPLPADRVHGELYRMQDPADLLPAFDAYEACSPDWDEPHEFLRRTVEVSLDDGALVTAICYLYTWDVSTATHVASGRFTEIAPEVR